MLLGEAWMKTWFCTEKSVASLLVKSPNSLWERHFGRSLGRKLRQFFGRSEFDMLEMLGWGWVGCVAWRNQPLFFHCIMVEREPEFPKAQKASRTKNFWRPHLLSFFSNGGSKETPHHCLGWAHELHWYGNLGCFSTRLSQIQRWHHRGSVGRNCRIWEDHKQSLGLFMYDSCIVYCILGNYIVDYVWYIRYICIRIEKWISACCFSL